jgi:UPF0755 protein
VTEEHQATAEHESEGPESEGLGDALGMREESHHSHRRGRRGGIGCLVLLVLMALVAGVMYVGLTRGVEWARDYFADPEDYPGPGGAPVLIEVSSGQNATDVAGTLEDADVVASREAFIAEANRRTEDAGNIQVGFYELRKKMSAEDALTQLSDPTNIRTLAVTVPEGLRVVDVVDVLVEKTGFKRARFLTALDRPRALGLPAYARGNPEGYLFPATYAFAPNATPATMLRQMVDRWKLAAGEAGLVEKARELGKTPAQIMTIASLVEAEGRGDAMPKIARVIYNRLDGPGDKGGTNGRLQIDASVNYGLEQKLGVTLTAAERAQDTPYNTYVRTGLPPTPIEAPGDAALEAALNPADGDWYYYVTVNLRTGATKFAETYDEFLRYKAEYTEYCQSSDAC